MNKINRKLEYALIGLKHMRSKQPGELTTAKEISSLYGAPFDATSRVMQILAQHGVLRSEQGAHGGYQLMKDLSRVSLHDMMEMIMGPVGIAKCMHEAEAATCEMHSACNIVSPIQNLNRRLIEFYRGLSVSEVLQAGKSPRPSDPQRMKEM
jgi:Rrf2 family nitric oxide-sensitive transcriptional repressor